MENLGLDEEWLERHYDFLLWADTISLLTICRPSSFTEMLRPRLGGTEFEFLRRDEERFHLTPWPFQENEYRFSYEFRKLAQKDYANESELMSALSHAGLSVREVTLSGS
jgi:hypothetical protein